VWKQTFWTLAKNIHSSETIEYLLQIELKNKGENMQDLGKTSTGIQPNVAALLSYLAGFITGIIFYLIEKDNQFVRFHALQSMIAFGAIFVLSLFFSFMPSIAVFLIPILNICALILWVVCMVKAYQGEKFKLPIVGDMAEQIKI
jgi:uncharacterized membrane protein